MIRGEERHHGHDHSIHVGYGYPQGLGMYLYQESRSRDLYSIRTLMHLHLLSHQFNWT